MASSKFYSYYLRGKQLALIEEDIDDNAIWKSPVSSVADGSEIEYAYSPRYFINNTNTTITTLTHYTSLNGYLTVRGGSVNYDTALDVGDYIVLKNAGEFNGLHVISAFSNDVATNDVVSLDIDAVGDSTAGSGLVVTLGFRIP